MKTVSTLFLVLAVSLIGIAPSVSLAENPLNYLVLKGGFYSPSKTFDIKDINGGVIDRVDTKTGFDGEVAIGHYCLPVFAAELGAGYFESKGSPTALPGETKLKVGSMWRCSKGVVQLSGFVDSAQSKSKAGEVAGGVKGVKSVKNDLVVK